MRELLSELKMLTLRKRGKSYHLDGPVGAFRLRGALGTGNQESARQRLHNLERAISDGPDAPTWSELKAVLPPATYGRIANVIGVKEKQELTWIDLRESFKTYVAQRIAIGKLANSTAARYELALREFDAFLLKQKISVLRDIGKPQVEKFKVWRIEQIKEKKQSRGGTGLVLDVAILHRVFALAVENEMIPKNPVRMEGRPGENPKHGAEPFSAAELSRLRDHSGDDSLSFLLLRWTGFRGSDGVALTWEEVHFESKEIERVTQKRKKKVVLPIHTELLFALEANFIRRNPQPTDRVLLNPATGRPLTRPRLYQRMLGVGKRAGVPDARPHRFRDTLAVDMLMRGASPYDVAKMLGDTIETVEKHYTPFVKELRERLRSMLENNAGLEFIVTPASQSMKQIQ
jgi:integrase